MADSFDVQQKPQYCKVIILQLNNFLKNHKTDLAASGGTVPNKMKAKTQRPHKILNKP